MKTSAWTKHMKARHAAHPKIIADIKSGMFYSEIGKKYDMSKQGVIWIQKKYGLPARGRKGRKKKA